MTDDDAFACLTFVRDLREVCARHALGLRVRDGQLAIIDTEGRDVTPMYVSTILPTLTAA